MKNINLGATFLFLSILCSIKIERLLFLKFLKILAFFDSYFWPFNKTHEKIIAIFVISAIMASIWNVFIKFHWHDEKLTAMIISRIPVLIVCLHIDQAWFQGRGNWRVCTLIRIAFIVALYQAWYIQSLLKIWISYWYSKVRSTKGLISSENYWYFFQFPKNMPRSILSFVFWISAGFLLT